MPVTNCVFNKRTGRPCYFDAIKIADGDFIFFIFGGWVEIVPAKIVPDFFSHSCFSRHTQGPRYCYAIKIANGDFIFFYFRGGVEIVPVEIFFSSRGV